MMQFQITATRAFRQRLAAALFAGLALLAGCNYDKVPPPEAPRRVVIDYRNGWYHTTNGSESIFAIATHYTRDPNLVAEINHSGGAYAVPPAGVMLYIPPTSDRAQVHQVLERLQGHPELIPRTPWDPSMLARATQPRPAATPAPLKLAQAAKTRYGDAPSPDPLHPPARADFNKNEPPPPAASEGVLAAGTVKKKRSGFWLFRTKQDNADEAPAKPAPRPVVKPRDTRPAAPAPATNALAWPAKGQIVTPFKTGWRQACHGIEIAVEEGTPIHAAQSGKVLLANDLPGYGKMIVIDHGNGFATMYGYTRELKVKEGQQVGRGQVIACVGRPSQGSSSKLLFQVRRNALPVDPLSYLKDS